MARLTRSTVLTLAAMLVGYSAYAAADWCVQGTILQDVSYIVDVVTVFTALTLVEWLFDYVQTWRLGRNGAGRP